MTIVGKICRKASWTRGALFVVVVVLVTPSTLLPQSGINDENLPAGARANE